LIQIGLLNEKRIQNEELWIKISNQKPVISNEERKVAMKDRGDAEY